MDSNAYNVDTMFIDVCTYTVQGRTYTRHLLRESFREDGKVRHRTLANLSHASSEEIQANHTYNEGQIEWFKAGSALNLIKAQCM